MPRYLRCSDAQTINSTAERIINIFLQWNGLKWLMLIRPQGALPGSVSATVLLEILQAGLHHGGRSPDARYLVGVRDLEGNVPQIIQSQLRGDGPQRSIGCVAIGAQMGQINVLQLIGRAFGNQSCGIDIG